MIRLKYYRTDDLLYTDWLTLGPNFIVRGIINTKTLVYQVVELNTDVVLEGQANSLRQAKDTLKTGLVSSGANFSGEIRRRQ